MIEESLQFFLTQSFIHNHIFPIVVILNLREVNANTKLYSMLKVGSSNWLSQSRVLLILDESCLMLALFCWALTALYTGISAGWLLRQVGDHS